MFGRDSSLWMVGSPTTRSLKNAEGFVQMVGCDMRSPRCGSDSPPTFEPQLPRSPFGARSRAWSSAHSSAESPSGTYEPAMGALCGRLFSAAAAATTSSTPSRDCLRASAFRRDAWSCSWIPFVCWYRL